MIDKKYNTKASQHTTGEKNRHYTLTGRGSITNYLSSKHQCEFEMLHQETIHMAHNMFLWQITSTIY